MLLDRADASTSLIRARYFLTHRIPLVLAFLVTPSFDAVAALLPSAPPGTGGGYFILKNSWGICAGDAGYYYVPFANVFNHAMSVTAHHGLAR